MASKALNGCKRTKEELTVTSLSKANVIAKHDWNVELEHLVECIILGTVHVPMFMAKCPKSMNSIAYLQRGRKQRMSCLVGITQEF